MKQTDSTQHLAARILMITSIVCLIILIVLTLPIHAAASIQYDAFTSAKMSVNVNATASLQMLTAAPSSDLITQFEVSGVWPNQCVPQFESVDYWPNSHLLITAIAEPLGSVCEAGATEWSFPVEFQFDTGPHIVELIVKNEQSDMIEARASTELIEVAGPLDVTPQNPKPNEPFTISVNGIHLDGCVPLYSSYDVVDYTIVVDVTTQSGFGPCTQALASWQVPVDFDGMEAGEYTVEIYVTNLFNVDQPERRLHNRRDLSVLEADDAAPVVQPVDEGASSRSLLEDSDLREVSYLPFILR